jgi:surface antigen
MHVTVHKTALRTLALALALCVGMAALADPPDHAKAHGWRKKNDPRYVGYTGREWEHDYGVLEGTCHRKAIGTALGAVVGGVVGSQIGDGDGRTVAIIVGSVLGAVVGREIGRDMDQGDRACVGHALELARGGQAVRWVNETTGVTYLLTPQGAPKPGEACRAYKVTATRAGKSHSTDGRACRAGDGTWKSS